jgi:RNA polymerase sigma-70 factor (ECF subfamily)
MPIAFATSPDDAPLVLARIAAGDERAVRDCVAAFGPMLMALARRWSPDVADAEDAVQEIFFDLWRNAARYDPAKASERGFVAMIARRRLIDRHRRQLRMVRTEPVPDGFDLADPDSDEADRVGDAMTAREVLTQLAPQQRRFIERHLLDGKTHEEIAAESSVPLGTVKSHIRRGLLKARALLGGRAAASEEDV